MKRWFQTILAAALLAACTNPPPPVPKVELRKLTGSTVELVPTSQQFSYCLLYTISEKGVVRQLTMTKENKSMRCEADKPIGGLSYRIPLDEGMVRIYVFLSSQKLSAGSVAQQIYELSGKGGKISPLDLRMPGEVKVEVLEFTPMKDVPVSTGAVVEAGGTLADAGTKAADAAVPGGDTVPAAGTAPAGAEPEGSEQPKL